MGNSDAPTNAIIHDTDNEPEPCDIEILYNNILKVRSELTLRTTTNERI
jgi:hypothetical protein